MELRLGIFEKSKHVRGKTRLKELPWLRSKLNSTRTVANVLDPGDWEKGEKHKVLAQREKKYSAYFRKLSFHERGGTGADIYPGRWPGGDDEIMEGDNAGEFAGKGGFVKRAPREEGGKSQKRGKGSQCSAKPVKWRLLRTE